MSVHLTSAAWRVSGLSVVQKIALVKLADTAGDDGKCWPSIATVARECGCDERSIYRALDTLESKRHISRSKRSGTSSIYIVHPCQAVTPDSLSPVTESPHPCQAVTQPLTQCQANRKGTVKNPKMERIPKAEPDPLPLPFSSSEFAEAIDSYRQHRKEIGKPLKPTGEKLLYRQLEKMGEKQSIASMSRSIANGWQGVFPEKQTGHQQPENRANNTKKLPTLEEMRAKDEETMAKLNLQ